MSLNIQIFYYSNKLNMIRMLRKKTHKQIQNIHSKSVPLENILARKYSMFVSR